MQELSEFKSSQKYDNNKFQNQLLEYEHVNSELLEELDVAKKYNYELLNKITEQNNKLLTLENELKKSVNDKDKLIKNLHDCKSVQKENNLQVGRCYNKL